MTASERIREERESVEGRERTYRENILWIHHRAHEIARDLKPTPGQNPDWRSGQQLIYARSKAERELLEILDSGTHRNAQESGNND